MSDGVAIVRGIVVAVLIGILFFVLNTISADIVQPEHVVKELVPEAVAQLAPQASAVSDAVDKAVSMLFSISLGLFVLLGFALKEMPTERRRSPSVLGWAVVFALSSVVAIYLAYLARLQSVHMVSRSIVGVRDSVETVISLQALSVAVSAVAALIVLMELLLSGWGKSTRAD